MYDILIAEAVRSEDVHPLGTISNLVHFRFGDIFRAVYAENLLAQKFIKVLFTKPGPVSNIGADILAYVPETMSVSMLPSVRSKLTLAVSRAESDILKEQIGTLMEDAERLSSAELIDVTWNPDIRVLAMMVRITARTGDAWIIRLPVVL